MFVCMYVYAKERIDTQSLKFRKKFGNAALFRSWLSSDDVL